SFVAHRSPPSSKSLPTRSLVVEVEDAGMQQLGKNLKRLYQPRARAVEKLVAVGQEHPTLTHRLERSPFRFPSKHGHVASRPLQVEAARQNDDDIRIAGRQLFPGHPRRMLAGFAKQIAAARQLNQ